MIIDMYDKHREIIFYWVAFHWMHITSWSSYLCIRVSLLTPGRCIIGIFLVVILPSLIYMYTCTCARFYLRHWKTLPATLEISHKPILCRPSFILAYRMLPLHLRHAPALTLKGSLLNLVFFDSTLESCSSRDLKVKHFKQGRFDKLRNLIVEIQKRFLS